VLRFACFGYSRQFWVEIVKIVKGIGIGNALGNAFGRIAVAAPAPGDR
jgi:hypothetical protein